ncbi:hypothetical protein [Patulibacter minatonensis]|uniref:hypothetical protein n=1 Tax=Patulibacter minatonensis TaxID=298163 RepID=UPI00047C47A9|nr:hypothetical protein [Patulibacter minatonensis]
MRSPSPRAASAALGLAAVLLAAPSVASAYDGGITAVGLTDARPGAVPRPLTIRIAQPTADPAPKDVRIAVQGLLLDPGTSSGKRIGSVDFETTLGAFKGLAISTAGPGDGAPGRWALTAPGVGTFNATVRPGTDLDAAGAPAAAAGSTLVGVSVPTDLPLGARVTSVTLRLNVDDKGCATTTPGATNPTAPGAYRIRAFVSASDGTSRVSDGAANVVAGAPAPPALPAGCPTPTDTGAGGAVVPAKAKPSVRVSASKRRIAPGGRTTLRVQVVNGPATVRIVRGSRTLKTLKRVRTAVKRYVFEASRSDAGKLVRLTVRPTGGKAKTVRIRVGRR